VGGNTRDGSTPFSRTHESPAQAGFSRLRSESTVRPLGRLALSRVQSGVRKACRRRRADYNREGREDQLRISVLIPANPEGTSGRRDAQY
jgi:hypothetical protein